MEQANSFFDFAAHVGLTKHLGGHQSTLKLVELCQIRSDSYVLDVGSGVGETPCFLAETIGCRVVGVDLNENMLIPSQARAERKNLSHLVEFKTADAQELPFPDAIFDAVITESVTVFPEEKTRAAAEYARVTKPGGYIGLNESTWLKLPVTPEIKNWISQDLGDRAVPLPAEGWVKLLADCGLEDITSEILTVDPKLEARGIIDRYGGFGVLRIYGRILKLYLRNPAYREFLKSLRGSGAMPPNIEEYFGYGIYTGRKAA